MALFLASDDSLMINGTDIVVDGAERHARRARWRSIEVRYRGATEHMTGPRP